MSLFQYLLIEGKKDVIVNKIKLPEYVADYCMRFFNKKFVLYWASAIQSTVRIPLNKEDLPYNKFINMSLVSVYKELEVLIRDPKLPILSKEHLNKFKSDDGRHENRAIRYINAYVTIRDYAEATNQNFQNDDFMETFQEAEEWHENLKASGNTIQLEGDMEVIHEFDDGYYWVDNHDNSCSIEGDAMGHCGNTNADTILSLRSPDGEPHISVAFDYDGRYRQAKGKQNKKPVEKYHPYMKWLFDNGGDYQIKSYSPEYQGGDDLTLSDFDDEFASRILDKYPSIDPVYKIRKILNDSSLSEEQKFEQLQEMDKENDTFGGELEEMSLNDEGRLIVRKDVDPLDYAGKRHDVFKWAMGILRYEDHLYFDGVNGVNGEFMIDSLDTKRYPFESEQIQYLIQLAKDDDEDLYNEQVDEFLEYEDTDETLEEYLSVGSYLVDFLKFLYKSGMFDEFEIALDRVSRWAMESTAYDEIHNDVVNHIKNTPLEDGVGDDGLEFVFEYSEEWHLVSVDGDAVDVSIPLDELLTIMEFEFERIADGYLVDYLMPYQFTEDMTQPHYGYPSGGIDDDVYNDYFEDAIYN